MKHLKKTRCKNFLLTGLALVSFIFSIVLPKLFSLAFPEAFEQNAKLITVLTMILFWAIGIVLFFKNFKQLILTEALAQNELLLKGDRKSFPSASGTFDADAIRDAFEKDGFTVRDEETGFVASRQTKSFDCTVAVTSSGTLPAFPEPKPEPKKAVGFLKIFLCDNVSDEQKNEAKLVEGELRRSVMTVFCDRQTGLAYYNGGAFPSSSAEALSQTVILHNVLLRDALPPKTDDDKTQDEIDLEEKDIRDLIYEFSHPDKEETEIAKTLQDGELRFDRNGPNGNIYYRAGEAVISHPFKVDGDGTWVIMDFSCVMVIYPKLRSAKNRELVAFKQVLEQKLAEDNVSFRYQ